MYVWKNRRTVKLIASLLYKIIEHIVESLKDGKITVEEVEQLMIIITQNIKR